MGTYTSAKKNAYDSTDIAHSVSKCISITCSVDGAYPSGQKCEIMGGKLGLAATCLYDMYLQLFFQSSGIDSKAIFVDTPLDRMYICTYDEHLESKDEFIMSCMP